MYGFPRPPVPNEVQWNRQRGPHNPQWRPFHQPRAPFRPRNQGFNRQSPVLHGSNEEYWCETCDRGFPNEDLLSKHKQQHQKCNIDGCQFIAHPKVITKHIQMQHSSGLYKKIANLNNPEEIEKWREERKKKYPTKVNIDRKAAELKEKIERGEKMNLARKEWHKNNENIQNRDSNHSGHGMKRTHNNNNNQQPAKFRKPRKPIPKVLPTPENSRTLPPFTGIQSLEIDSDEEVEESINNDGLIEDDEIESAQKVTDTPENNTSQVTDKPVVCSALSSLMCEYGSSDEEIDNEASQPIIDNEISKVNKSQVVTRENTFKLGSEALKNPLKENNTSQVNKESLNITNKNNAFIQGKYQTLDNNTESIASGKVEAYKNARNCDISSKSNDPTIGGNDKLDINRKTDENVEDDDSGPDEVKVEKQNETLVTSKENETHKNISKKKVEVVKRKMIYRKPKPKLPSTLIYKLLSKEMKQERNQVLQCIRYIRKNNYFDNNVT